MAETPRDRRTPVPVATGLRLRIWVGCLLGALLGAAAALVTAGVLLGASSTVEPTLAAVLPWVAAGVPLVAGFAAALWLDRGIVRPLRDMSAALAAPEVKPLGAGAGGWGEIGAVGRGLAPLLARLEQCGREARELRAVRQRLEATLAELIATLHRWAGEEAPGEGAAAPVEAASDLLARRGERDVQERARARERALDVASELSHDLGLAREAVEHAERGFVEATGLLSGLREMERLGGELGAALEAASPERVWEAQREALAGFRAAAAGAIQELATASVASVDRIAGGLRRVQEIAEHVQVLGNRSTLIALESATRRPPDPEAAEALRRLVREAQGAVARTAELARDVDREIEAAAAVMRGLRERTAEALARAPEAPGAEPNRAGAPAAHLAQRLREILSDATARGERIAAAGERASSAVERLVRRLEADALALDQLASGMGPGPGSPS